MDQLVERISNNKSSKKFIAITFDDGYIDNYTIAYPLLKEMSIPFTVYVSTGMPDHQLVLWPYFLEEYLLNTACAEFQFNGIEYKRNLVNLDDRELAYHEIRNIILKEERNIVPFLVKHVFRINDARIKQFTVENSLTWEHLKEMSRDSYVTIGAHGISHLASSALTDSFAFDEVHGSKKRLEEQLHIEINHFAFPYGTDNEFSVRDIDLVKRAGFLSAVTLKQGNIFSAHKKYLFNLPRIPLGDQVNEEKLDHICSGIRHFSFNGFKKVSA
jgi:peptidoglycan/xylan/chitin deacetylase (PgdA/CDA1 family)